MSNSKKKKVLDRLYDLKDDIGTMQTIPEFHGWLAEVLDVADIYIKSRNPYNKLLELNEHAKLDASIIDSRILQPNLRSKAVELIKGCINIIEREGIYVEKKTFLETIFDTKALLAFIGVLLTIITTLYVVGQPNAYNRGFNTAKEIYSNSKQGEIDILRGKVDSLYRKVTELRDSISILKK